MVRVMNEGEAVPAIVQFLSGERADARSFLAVVRIA
jgi:hypothetical protein